MDVEQARFNMIEQQIRTWEVLDPAVLDLLFIVKREDFVPAAYRELAFSDMEIPLGHGELMLAPKLEARMLQEVHVTKAETVLEIGTGSGYMTALLAHESKHVHSIERIADFSEQAKAKLAAHGVNNVTLEMGDAMLGLTGSSMYDVIVLTGSVPVLPEQVKQRLAVKGRLIAVVGEPPVMEARLITRVTADAYRSVALFETCIPRLANALSPSRFVF